MSKRKAITVVDILRKAAALLAEPLPHEWACCDYGLGPYCPRCAVAYAKSELTREMSFDAHDVELIFARGAIADVIGRDRVVLSQSEAIAVVETAISNQMEPTIQ